jgi:hypothetical protein
VDRLVGNTSPEATPSVYTKTGAFVEARGLFYRDLFRHAQPSEKY